MYLSRLMPTYGLTCLVWLNALLVSADLQAANVVVTTEAKLASVPVMVGEVEDLDACLGFGTVKDLKHSLLAVRAGPGSNYEQLDELDNGRQVHICSSSDDEVWLGVVYAPAGSDLDCGVSSPLPEAKAYDGPCQFGWVHHRWLDTGE